MGCRNIDSKKKQLIIKCFGFVLVIVCFAFLAKSIIEDKPNFSLIKRPYETLAVFVFSIIFFAIVVYVSSFAWKMILEFLYGKKIEYKEIRGVYVKSNIGKYLPGNVMHFAGRNMLGKKLGFSHIDMALSTVIEVLVLLFATCLWSLIFAYRSFVQALQTAIAKANVLVWVFLIMIVAVLAVAVIFYAYKKGILKKFKKLLSLDFLKVFVKLFLIYSATLIIPGILLMLIFTIGLGIPFSINTALLIIAAYMISWACGYVAIGVPGGLGVREIIICLIMSTICPKGITILAALLHRVASIFGDAVAFLIEIFLEHKNRKG